jgi:phosphatidylserine decarboxylase
LTIAKEGYPFIVITSALALVAWASGWAWAGLGLALLAAAFLAFFRDPKRIPPQGEGLILSPADGKVMKILGRENSGAGEEGRLSIFLSPLDVHINRVPVEGQVREVQYRKGRFFAAYGEKAIQNESNSVKIVDPKGRTISVVQIAGFLARRIVCYARPGDHLRSGEKFGMIMFGSRVDVSFPAGARIEVVEGQRVRGGETVIGRLP